MKWVRYTLSLLLVSAMAILAEYSGEHEIIFPEIVALCLGAWVADRQPWKGNRLQIFSLMAVSAFFGMCLVRFVPAPTVVLVAVAFAFAAVMLMVTGTTLVPVLSACILPVLLHTDTWVYPISVCVLTGMVILVQYCLEKWGIRQAASQQAQTFPVHPEPETLLCWGKQGLLVLVFALIALTLNLPLLIAPPLIVTFVEFCNPDSKVRQYPKKVWLVLSVAACLGAGMRLVFQTWLGAPLWIVAVLTALCLFVCLDKLRFLFPPAGAIALLPLLLKPEVLVWYPLQVALGGAALIFAAIYWFRPQEATGGIQEVQE